MRYRALSVSILALLGSALAVRADVAPFPSWRLVANGAVTGAVQSGQTIYLGGAFTKIGRGIAPFDAFLDPATLALTADPGCARDGDTVLTPFEDGSPRLVPYGARLRDGAGPFALDGVARYVRVGSDCRFDRRFAIWLPPSFELIGRPIPTGGAVYSVVSYRPEPSTTSYVIAAFDAITGDLVRYWPMSGYVELVGATPDGRLAVTYTVMVSTTLAGWFDPTTGVLVQAQGGGGSQAFPLGTRVLVVRTSWEGTVPVTELELEDITTWQRLPQWPRVRFERLGEVEAVVASAGRVVIFARGELQIDGQPSRGLVAFDEVTGAHDPEWSAPDWMDPPASTVRHVVPVGSRLLVHGDFAPGSPRDTIAALDMATGTLDPWEFPLAAGTVAPAGGAIYAGPVVSTRRVARRYLAAVAASDGALLPWDPGSLLPVGTVAPVSALSADSQFVYVASFGAVRRYATDSASPDESWRLDVSLDGVSGAEISSIAVGPTTVYVTGGFYSAKDSEAGAWQPRAGGAAVRKTGGLMSWQHPLGALCFRYVGRIIQTYPCVAQALVSQDRVFLRGELQTPGVVRSIAVVTADAGAVDPGFPVVQIPVPSMAADGDVVFVGTVLGDARLARIDPGLRISLLETPVQSASALAARHGRVYADRERDAVTGAPTGNPVGWQRPLAVADGVFDVETFSDRLVNLAWYSDLAPRAPGTPTGLAASLSGATVTLRWSRAAGELEPLVSPPPPGGTAAISHLVLASLTPGGPAIAQLDTGSPDTAYTVTAPAGVFFVRVQARNAFGISPPSDEARVEVRPSAPDAPLATVATVIGHEVRVRWQAAPQGWPATGYVLEAGTQPGTADIGAWPVSGLGFRASGVPAGRYHVRVRAVNANGLSVAGNEVLVLVP